jgi:hypothetical protein
MPWWSPQYTERYGRSVLHACEKYSDLSWVRRDLKCSAGWLYTALCASGLVRHLTRVQR